MNIPKIFETQAVLDAHININHPIQENENRITDKTLALLVELSEFANEWSKFKFWSNDQKPRTTLACEICRGEGGHYNTYDDNKNKTNKVDCRYCSGTGAQEGVNPLLEEFVDCLHFIVSIGLDLGVNPEGLFAPVSSETVTSETFLSVNNDVLTLDLKRSEAQYIYTFARIMELGLGVGFTSKEVEDAYYSKNEVNHQRQVSNY